MMMSIKWAAADQSSSVFSELGMSKIRLSYFCVTAAPSVNLEESPADLKYTHLCVRAGTHTHPSPNTHEKSQICLTAEPDSSFHEKATSISYVCGEERSRKEKNRNELPEKQMPVFGFSTGVKLLQVVVAHPAVTEKSQLKPSGVFSWDPH